VPKAGLEPARDCSHTPLKRARLPIPPLRRGSLSLRSRPVTGSTSFRKILPAHLHRSEHQIYEALLHFDNMHLHACLYSGAGVHIPAPVPSGRVYCAPARCVQVHIRRGAGATPCRNYRGCTSASFHTPVSVPRLGGPSCVRPTPWPCRMCTYRSFPGLPI
jgi:hypothetical protein